MKTRPTTHFLLLSLAAAVVLCVPLQALEKRGYASRKIQSRSFTVTGSTASQTAPLSSTAAISNASARAAAGQEDGAKGQDGAGQDGNPAQDGSGGRKKPGSLTRGSGGGAGTQRGPGGSGNAGPRTDDAGCPLTGATQVQRYVSGNTPYGPNRPDQSTAVLVQITQQMLGRLVLATIVETAQSDSGADVQFNVSNCPGDFTKTAPCMGHTQYTGGSVRFSIGPKPPDTPWYMNVCELPAGTSTVYFNFRHIRRPTPVPPSAPGTPSCPERCSNYVQLN